MDTRLRTLIRDAQAGQDTGLAYQALLYAMATGQIVLEDPDHAGRIINSLNRRIIKTPNGDFVVICVSNYSKWSRPSERRTRQSLRFESLNNYHPELSYTPYQANGRVLNFHFDVSLPDLLFGILGSWDMRLGFGTFPPARRAALAAQLVSEARPYIDNEEAMAWLHRCLEDHLKVVIQTELNQAQYAENNAARYQDEAGRAYLYYLRQKQRLAPLAPGEAEALQSNSPEVAYQELLSMMVSGRFSEETTAEDIAGLDRTVQTPFGVLKIQKESRGAKISGLWPADGTIEEVGLRPIVFSFDIRKGATGYYPENAVRHSREFAKELRYASKQEGTSTPLWYSQRNKALTISKAERERLGDLICEVAQGILDTEDGRSFSDNAELGLRAQAIRAMESEAQGYLRAADKHKHQAGAMYLDLLAVEAGVEV